MPDQNNSQFHVNTNGIVMWSNDDQLKISFYDNCINVQITHAITDENGRKKYPRDMAKSALFTQDRAYALSDILSREIIPAVLAGDTIQRSISLNANSTNMAKLSVGDDGIVTLYLFLDLEERIPKTQAKYQFAVLPGIFSKYDPENGEFELIDKPVQAQLALFASSFNEFVHACTFADAHFTRMSGQQRMSYLIGQIAMKNGIDTINNRVRPNRTGNSFQNQNNAPQAPQVQSVSSIADMMGASDLPIDND